MAATLTIIAWGLAGAPGWTQPTLLRRALGRALTTPLAVHDAEAALLAAFGRQDNAGAAGLALAVEHPQLAGTANACLRCDPVHLQADLREVHLNATATLGLEADEADALLEALNGHFAEEGLRFLRGESPARWYVLADRPVDLRSAAPTRAPMMPVRSLAISGSDAPAWRRIATEAQMLLHAHPVNAGRARRGEPAVNSLWFWGGGEAATMAADVALPARVVATDPLALALADASGAVMVEPGRALPRGHGHTLYYDTRLRDALFRADPAAWSVAAAALLRDALSPAIKALTRGRLRRVCLIHEHGQAELALLQWMQFWRCR